MAGISLSFLENIEAIPHLLHPPIVHFVIVIPVIILLMEILNIIFNRKTLSGFVFIFLVVLCLAVLAAYAAGSVDGKAAFDVLSSAGQEELKEHKALGSFIVIGAFAVLIFKFIAMISSHPLVRAVYILVLILFVGATLKQGKDGGELVYEYGANVVKVKELDDKLFDMEFTLDELKSENEALKAKLQSTVDDAASQGSKQDQIETQSKEGAKEQSSEVSDANVTAESTDEQKKDETNTTTQKDTIQKIKQEVVKIKDKVDRKIEDIQEAAQKE